MARRKITTRSLKRKLEQDFIEEDRDRKMQATAPAEGTVRDLETDIRAHVATLNSTFSSSPDDRVSAKSATQFLCQLAKKEDIVNLIVNCHAVPALVMHLQTPPVLDGKILYEHEVERGSAFTLGLLAMKPEFQQLIVNAGALSHLVDLLKRHKGSDNSRALIGVIRRSADTITNLAHENCSIKTLVRIEGGIPPLVELLDYDDVKVQRAAAGALRTLAFKNDENKKLIVECNALPTLILMLRSEDAITHFEAVGVIGNLVHSSPNIKNEVLLAGALQPVIGLLSSPCAESQREAALLLGQFAAANSDCKVHISQRGAVPPLINMLENSDGQIKEMAAFALGRLAQEAHNQAGIAHNGGMAPLIALLESKNGPLQHNAAFALYGLVDNEDNIADFIKLDGVQKLLDGEFAVQPTKDCVAKTLKRVEDKIHGPVLNHLLYLMKKSEKAIQRRIALALANLCAPCDRKNIFLNCNALQLLLDLLKCGSLKEQRDSSMALYKLATEAISATAVDDAPLSPTTQVYLGEQYVNNPTLSDVTFLIEGKQFYAHRICLLASSDTFRAMFDGGYRERDAKDVEIPNIKWDVFELMMRFIYTGSVDINNDIAHDLLIAADQYLLEGLKRLCECTIAKDISVENISSMYELSENFNATALKEACLLFMFLQFDKLSSKPWCSHFIKRVMPEIYIYLTKALSKLIEAKSR